MNFGNILLGVFSSVGFSFALLLLYRNEPTLTTRGRRVLGVFGLIAGLIIWQIATNFSVSCDVNACHAHWGALWI